MEGGGGAGGWAAGVVVEMAGTVEGCVNCVQELNKLPRCCLIRVAALFGLEQQWVVSESLSSLG